MTTNGEKLLMLIMITKFLKIHIEYVVDNYMNKIDNDKELISTGKLINDISTIIKSSKTNIELALKYITITNEDRDAMDKIRLHIIDLAEDESLGELYSTTWEVLEKEIEKQIEERGEYLETETITLDGTCPV